MIWWRRTRTPRYEEGADDHELIPKIFGTKRASERVKKENENVLRWEEDRIGKEKEEEQRWEEKEADEGEGG